MEAWRAAAAAAVIAYIYQVQVQALSCSRLAVVALLVAQTAQQRARLAVSCQQLSVVCAVCAAGPRLQQEVLQQVGCVMPHAPPCHALAV
jgi:hypothetical protein